MDFKNNSQLQMAYNYLQYTNQNVFLTGKAGTGKTTFLRNLRSISPKRMVVVAPTGVAAINAGGVTIHSFFQISFGPQIPSSEGITPQSAQNGSHAAAKRFNREKINIIRSLDLLVIDEISMVRADLLDAIDEVLRRFKNRYQPFGGVQLLMIGDLQQLAPVVKDDEWDLLKSYYDTCFFFSSRALQKSNFVGIELQHIYRQSDQRFINLLNRVRENRIDQTTLDELNSRYIPNFAPSEKEGYITLTTHNYQAQQINDSKLTLLANKAHTFAAIINGDFPEYIYPTEVKLVLKTGAQVMFVKNDPSPEKLFYNGKIGKIVSINSEMIEVLCPGETSPLVVEPLEWQNCKYKLNEQTQEIEEDVVGTFKQFPLKLAWAITIHKSQGLTFERAIIDARLSFAHGQVYVALSRCKSIEGMVLRTPIEINSVKNDQSVLSFSNHVEQNQPSLADLEQARLKFTGQLLIDLFDFKPFLRHLQNLVRFWGENNTSLQGNFLEQIAVALPVVQTNLVDVAEKFKPTLEKLVYSQTDPDQNKALQERVSKAAQYFAEKLQVHVGVCIANMVFQSDNKAVTKLMAESLEKLNKEFALKKACIDAVKVGFNIKTYLETRAKAQIEQPDIVKRSTSVADLAQVKYPELYKKLIKWRNQVADQSNIEIARVIRQTALLEIANYLPSTSAQLKAIKGFGGKKLQEYGKDILKIVIAFKREQGMELPVEAEKELKKVTMNTYEQSYDLFCAEKSIEKVAQVRGLAESTIFGHLLRYVESGQINVNDLINRERYNHIASILLKHKGKTLNELRAILGEEYAYNEIKLVGTHMGL